MKRQEIFTLTASYLPRLFQGIPSRPPGVFAINTTAKSMGRFSRNFQEMLVMTQRKIWNMLGMIGLTPWTRFLFIFWVRVCWQHHRLPDGWTFKKFSGYGHKKQ